MNKFILISIIILLTVPAQAEKDSFNYEKFANNYFDAWTATQAPDATTVELDNYLMLLADDVGHQHIPYDNDDTRSPDGKQKIRKGMSYYLGKHITYRAELISISYGLNAIAIQFNVALKAKRGPDSPVETMSYSTMEVLEIENGKVSMIRKYN